jgi:hypothetical protein
MNNQSQFIQDDINQNVRTINIVSNKQLLVDKKKGKIIAYYNHIIIKKNETRSYYNKVIVLGFEVERNAPLCLLKSNTRKPV